MKRFTLILLVAGLWGCTPGLWADDEVAEPFPPKPIPADRYTAIMKRSPFVLPTHEEDEVAATWASDYQIVSILKHKDEYTILAKSVSTDERFPIRVQENAQGIRLIKLTMSSDPREVSALIEKGGTEGTIEYDPSILSEAPQTPASDNPALKTP